MNQLDVPISKQHRIWDSEISTIYSPVLSWLLYSNKNHKKGVTEAMALHYPTDINNSRAIINKCIVSLDFNMNLTSSTCLELSLVFSATNSTWCWIWTRCNWPTYFLSQDSHWWRLHNSFSQICSWVGQRSYHVSYIHICKVFCRVILLGIHREPQPQEIKKASHHRPQTPSTEKPNLTNSIQDPSPKTTTPNHLKWVKERKNIKKTQQKI